MGRFTIIAALFARRLVQPASSYALDQLKRNLSMGSFTISGALIARRLVQPAWLSFRVTILWRSTNDIKEICVTRFVVDGTRNRKYRGAVIVVYRLAGVTPKGGNGLKTLTAGITLTPDGVDRSFVLW